MPSVMYEVEDAIGKRKREFNAIDERDIEREKEIQMKLAAARYVSISPSLNPMYCLMSTPLVLKSSSGNSSTSHSWTSFHAADQSS